MGLLLHQNLILGTDEIPEAADRLQHKPSRRFGKQYKLTPESQIKYNEATNIHGSDQRVYRQLPPNLPTDSEGVQLLAEKSDWREFIDLLKRCLRSNKSTGEAMNRSFASFAHLVDYAHRINVNASV